MEWAVDLRERPESIFIFPSSFQTLVLFPNTLDQFIPILTRNPNFPLLPASYGQKIHLWSSKISKTIPSLNYQKLKLISF